MFIYCHVLFAKYDAKRYEDELYFRLSTFLSWKEQFLHSSWAKFRSQSTWSIPTGTRSSKPRRVSCFVCATGSSWRQGRGRNLVSDLSGLYKAFLFRVSDCWHPRKAAVSKGRTRGRARNVGGLEGSGGQTWRTVGSHQFTTTIKHDGNNPFNTAREENIRLSRDRVTG